MAAGEKLNLFSVTASGRHLRTLAFRKAFYWKHTEQVWIKKKKRAIKVGRCELQKRFNTLVAASEAFRWESLFYLHHFFALKGGFHFFLVKEDDISVLISFISFREEEAGYMWATST